MLFINQFCKNWLNISREDANARQSTTDNGRQTIAIGHLIDFGDVIKKTIYPPGSTSAVDNDMKYV